MSQIIDTNHGYLASPPVRSPLGPAGTPRITPGRFPEDRFEFSRAALDRAVQLSSLRIARTTAIRAEIESGDYETPVRINGTVERLLDVIG